MGANPLRRPGFPKLETNLWKKKRTFTPEQKAWTAEAKRKQEVQCVRDPEVRKLFFAWKERSPTNFAHRDRYIHPLNAKVDELIQRFGDDWFDRVMPVVHEYFDAKARDRRSGRGSGVSVADLLARLECMLEDEERRVLFDEQPKLYDHEDLLSVEDVFGEDECGWVFAQRCGDPRLRGLVHRRFVADADEILETGS